MSWPDNLTHKVLTKGAAKAFATYCTKFLLNIFLVFQAPYSLFVLDFHVTYN